MIDFVWGVDPAIGHVSIASAPMPEGDIVVESITNDTTSVEGERLGLLDRQMRIWASQLAWERPPAAVFVEQPSGARINFPLTYAVGVIQAALYETLRCPVWTIPSGKWKKWALGYGNASKEQIAAWVASQGVDLSIQDEADAYGIAVAGRMIVESRRWEQAA